MAWETLGRKMEIRKIKKNMRGYVRKNETHKVT